MFQMKVVDFNERSVVYTVYNFDATSCL